MSSTQKPESLRLADKYEAHGFLGDHRFAQEHWCKQAAAELRRQHARIAELEAQLSAIGAGGVEPLRKPGATPQAVHAAEPETREALAKRLIADVQVADTIATSACQRVAELPDRDSPANWPESMLVTGDALRLAVHLGFAKTMTRFAVNFVKCFTGRANTHGKNPASNTTKTTQTDSQPHAAPSSAQRQK